MRIWIVTYGKKINSDDPKKREFFVESYKIYEEEAKEPAELKETVYALSKAIEMMGRWIVLTPEMVPWYWEQQCKYCVKYREQRYKRKGTMYYDWWFYHCPRHAAAEFLQEIWIVDNKTREIEIDLEEEEIVLDVCTGRHSARYMIKKDEIIAELDEVPFRYRPHRNSHPYLPTYSYIIRNAMRLIDELLNVLLYPERQRMNIYYNNSLYWNY